MGHLSRVKFVPLSLLLAFVGFLAVQVFVTVDYLYRHAIILLLALSHGFHTGLFMMIGFCGHVIVIFISITAVSYTHLTLPTNREV